MAVPGKLPCQLEILPTGQTYYQRYYYTQGNFWQLHGMSLVTCMWSYCGPTTLQALAAGLA